MIRFPNCKINLGLAVRQKRDDGFHNIESVFYPLPLCDALELTVSENMDFKMYGTSIPGEHADNLVLKAYYLLQRQFEHRLPPMQIALLKKIPAGAGLGGGSSDAVMMLKMLNTLCGLRITDEVLAQYALQLGSDCPFFVKNIPALAKGRGEILEPVQVDLSAYRFLILKPDIHISTAMAFSMIVPEHDSAEIADIIKQPIALWKDELKNDFEKPIFEMHPAIKDLKALLYDHGAVYSAMSGSGSAVYGIFSDDSGFPMLKSKIRNAKVFTC